jgi:hypothetical protein
MEKTDWANVLQCFRNRYAAARAELDYSRAARMKVAYFVLLRHYKTLN